MAVPLEKFVQQLEDSGIVAADTLKDFLPPKASPQSAVELALELVRNKKLTKFQAEEVSRGKGKSLIMGNYVLMEKVGAGGMGQVFKARHRRMDRLVAVKLLPDALTRDKAAIARFEREVKAVAKISHPNIVAAHDADCANGVHFLVMELVDGIDLSALVKRNGPFPVEQAVNYILQAARGLEAAHAEGIVHRDIKPANLLLDKKGTIKVLDMGLARLSLDGDDAPQTELTNTGTIMGTVDYMAPEQAEDTRTADARADIYSLGCSLFYLLTGRASYEGETLIKKVLAHRNMPIPSLRAIRPEVPEYLETVFKKMVAKHVEDRYQTMTTLIIDLESCSSVHSTTKTIEQSASSTLEKTAAFTFSDKTSTEPTILAPTAELMAPGKMGNNRKMALIGAAFLGAVMLAAIFILLPTQNGTLIVTVDQLGAMVFLDDKESAQVIQKDGKGTFSIPVAPGTHRLKIEKDGFQLFAEKFEMKMQGRAEIAAKLIPLNDQAVAETRKLLAFEKPGFDIWIKGVRATPAEKQVEVFSKKLVELNPEFDGKVAHTIEYGVVTWIQLVADNITDISPIKAFNELKVFYCPSSGPGTVAKLVDLTPLQGLPLTTLNCNGTSVVDFSPLKGMPLTVLWFGGTQVSDLAPLRNMKLTSFDCGFSKVSDLRPLQGMPLTDVRARWTAVSDLTPLKDMKLTVLDITRTAVSDLSPLRVMPLKELVFDFNFERDADLIRSIKSLEFINHKPAAEFWMEVKELQKGQKLAFQTPGFDQWVNEIATLPAEKQVEAVSKKLMELNPGYDGKVTSKIENGEVTELSIIGSTNDISPVRALTRLRILGCTANQGLSDLSPLQGMKLEQLYCSLTRVSDLTGLRGIPLKVLHLFRTPVTDLSPLEGMPLSDLDCNRTNVSDLSPLEKCKYLKWVAIVETRVTPAGVAALQSALPNCKIDLEDPEKPKTP